MSSSCSAARNQVTILGINSLFGKVVSFLLKQSPVANRLVLYDEVDIGVAHDIAEIPTPCKVVVYNGEEQLRCAVKNSDVILIGDKDDCLANEDEAISRKATDIIKYANAISSLAPTAIVLIAATPVNSLLPLFTEALIGCGTFDGDKVMGVTSADTMRASTLLARQMGIEPEKAYLPVIGGSSADTRIPLFSQSRPTIHASKDDLKNLTRVVKTTENELKRMLNRGESLNKAYATVQLIDSVMSALRGQRNISEIVLSRTCLVPNVDYFSLPVILGRRGIAHRFPLPSLTERESILLDHAVKHIEIEKMKGINALSGICCIPQEPEVSEKYSELITDGCQKNFVGSLMEKFKLGAACPEVCEPRVEYKLLSKVKLKLPPEATPSEMPKRTKFIEPDTPPQDGCCPLKLPCLPIPPIRGLNQIQAKHTCKSKDISKVCKCFFPPVEKSLIPCKLCPSNKPCVDYGDHKAFYAEHSHCCGPVNSAREDSSFLDIALIPTGTTDSQNPIAAHHNYSAQPVTQVSSNSSHTNVLSIRLGAIEMEPKQMSVQAVWDYPSNDQASKTDSKPIPATAQQQQHTSINLICPPGKEISPHGQSGISNSQPFISKHKESEPRSTLGTAAQTSSPCTSNLPTTSTTNQTTPQSSIQSGTIQHDDPSWPFKCSTALCLDILAPQTPVHQFPKDKLVLPGDHVSNPSAQKQTELKNIQNTKAIPYISPQNPGSVQPAEPNTTTSNPHEQNKRYNYSSGLSLKNTQETIEGISKDPPGTVEIRPLDNYCSTHSGHREESNHTTTEQNSVGIHNGCWKYYCSFPMLANDKRTGQVEKNSSNLKECYNKSAPLSSQKPPDHYLNTETSTRLERTNAQDPRSAQSTEGRVDTNNQQEQHEAYNYRSEISLTDPQEVTNRSEVRAESYSFIRKSPTISEEAIDHTGTKGHKTSDERSARDENVKRRLYATLKIIEDIKYEPQPSTSISNKSIGLSLSQHFRDGSENLRDSKRIPGTGEPEGTSGNSMLSILRERAKAINANMELQRDLRACLDRSKKRRKETHGLGDLMDAINPAKRLTKRLESRPALKKSYQGHRQIYEYPKHLGNQGKSASILATPKPGHKEKSIDIVKDAKGHKKLSSRIDRIKDRIQEALKKIVYPTDTPPEIKPMEKTSTIQQRLSQKLSIGPAMSTSTKAKRDFFVQLRKTDPAYKPTTRLYAPKCPTRLLYDDHPNNHSKMITFNNVIENETVKDSSLIQTHNEACLNKDTRKMKDAQGKGGGRGFNLPDFPNFPELILKVMDPEAIPTDVGMSNALYSKGNTKPGGIQPKRLPKYRVGSNEAYSQNRNPQETRSSGPVHGRGDDVKHFETQLLPKDIDGSLGVDAQGRNPEEKRETRSSGPVRLRGDYVKHFDNQLLSKDLNLPERIKAAIREHSRNVSIPGRMTPQRFNDMRYRMTSPNRLTYSKKRITKMQ